MSRETGAARAAVRTRTSQTSVGLSRSGRAQDYSRFETIDGQHPWQQAVPEGYVLYQARRLNRGKVVYFNFDLAKEMGLIPREHPHTLNTTLEKKIIDTFSIQIINEYDVENKTRIPKEDILPNKYMATRYLQLQHPDKTGRTSGDGRSIWNGVVHYRGKTWDVSSRGTGVTRLSPGFIEAGRPLQTGDSSFGYGCGTADLDEMISAALMSDIFHKQGIPTERTLVVIDVGSGNGIGVRAQMNLMRPAHLFCHLKQGNLKALRAAVNYVIERQHTNGEWNFGKTSPHAVRKMVLKIVESFAKFCARADADYLFVWMDWDGDNILLNGGIIDYGSIRQFGLRHDRYQYDDIERYSTTLNTQRKKARLICQSFAQLEDYLKTGRRRPLKRFRHSPHLKYFDHLFNKELRRRILYRSGFTSEQAAQMMSRHKTLVEKYFGLYRKLEALKTDRKQEKLPDGINVPPITNMRRALKDLPDLLSVHATLSEGDLVELFAAESASTKDLRKLHRLLPTLKEFMESYKKMIAAFPNPEAVRRLVHRRSLIINREDRITGNSIDNITWAFLRSKRRFAANELLIAMDLFVKDQSRAPDEAPQKAEVIPLRRARISRLLERCHDLVLEYKEDI